MVRCPTTEETRTGSKGSRAGERMASMKGPAARNRHIVLRSWICPICGDVRLVPGQETLSPCPACSDAVRTVWMVLHEGPVPEIPVAVPKRPGDSPSAEGGHAVADSPDE